MLITLEEKQRFSQSIIWESQKAYYDKEGIDAWTSDVPFYVTSNPFIANAYANVIIAFIRDCITKNPNALDNPFYILELGTGPGQFSFYLLTMLDQILKKLHRKDIKLRYIMSDFTENNIQFWEQHEKLRPFIESGMLDFAQLDLLNGQELTLKKSGISLGRDSIENPLIVIANYIFDTLPTDVFKIKDEKLYESLVTFKSEKNNVQDNKPKNWEKIKIEHSDKEIKGNYYKDPHYNRVLKTYKELLEETHFLFPVETLNSMKRLQSMADGKMFVISSDKAYSTAEEQDNADFPELAFHGSFSVMANFDAIGRVFVASGGDTFVQTQREGIATAIFASGMKLKDFPETSLAIEQHIEGFSPGDYFVLHDQIGTEPKKTKLEVYAALLSMSLWDPYVYELISEPMMEQLTDPDYDTLEYLVKKMHQVAKNFYFVPGCEDVLFNVGLFYHETERYQEAIPLYEASIRTFGEQHVAVFNLGICHYEIGELKPALSFFKRALELDPKEKDTKDWIKTVEKAINAKKTSTT